MTCICGHLIKNHDSGGSCQMMFCPCVHVVASMTTFSPPPPAAPRLSDYAIESASFADLTAWAYKARTALKEAGQ